MAACKILLSLPFINLIKDSFIIYSYIWNYFYLLIIVYRSEMHVASVSVRFGLILEAYCRGSQEHMKSLMKQMDFLDKLKINSELIRQRKDKEKAKNFLQETLSEPHCFEALSCVQSPLDPSFRCKRVRSVCFLSFLCVCVCGGFKYTCKIFFIKCAYIICTLLV